MLAGRGTGRTTQGATVRGRSLAEIELQYLRDVMRHGKGGTNDSQAGQRAQERLDNFRRVNGIGAPRGPKCTQRSGQREPEVSIHTGYRLASKTS